MTNKMTGLGTITYIEWDNAEFTEGQNSIGSCCTAYCHFFSRKEKRKKQENRGGGDPMKRGAFASVVILERAEQSTVNPDV